MSTLSFLRTALSIPFVWTIPPCGDIAQADCIITHAGARNSDGGMGLINEAINNALWRLPEHLPVLAQGDFAPLVAPERLLAQTPWQGDPEEVRREWLESIGVNKKAPYYIETRDVALWHRNMCTEHGFSRPILLSYNPHIVRAYWATKKVGLDPIVPSISPAIYDPTCSQPWMRSRLHNGLREIAARGRDLLFGNI